MQLSSCLTFIIIVLLVHIVRLDDDFLSKFVQNDYKLKDIRVELDSVNDNFVRCVKVKTFKFNRTTPAINISENFRVDIGKNLECLVQAYKFSSNEFKIFPIRFQINGYKAYHANIGGLLSTVKCGYLNGTYFVKDTTYSVCNFVVDETKFPPYLPSGRYRYSLMFMYIQQELYTLSAYAEVYRPIYSKY